MLWLIVGLADASEKDLIIAVEGKFADVLQKEQVGFEPTHGVTRLTHFECVLFSHLSTAPWKTHG